MKIVKIVLVVMAIALIAFFTWKGIAYISKPYVLVKINDFHKSNQSEPTEESSSPTTSTTNTSSSGNATPVNSPAVTESQTKKTIEVEKSTDIITTVDADIKAYLKSDFTYVGLKEKLEGIEDGTLKIRDSSLKSSIQLALKFWSLPTSETTYYSYLGKLKKDNNLNNSKLKDVLDEIYEKYKEQSPPAVSSIQKNITESITNIGKSITNQ